MFGGAISTTSTLDQQLELLNFDSELTEEAESSIHNVKNAVLFSGTTLDHYGHQVLPQYGLLGSSALTSTKTSDSRLFLNTNIPFSAFICGVQGSGKSHSTACMIGMLFWIGFLLKLSDRPRGLKCFWLITHRELPDPLTASG